MNTQDFKAAFNRHLTDAQFKRKAACWYRNTHGSLQVINLKEASRENRLHINIGCVPEGMEDASVPLPKEHECPVRVRLGEAYPARTGEVDHLLNLDDTSLDDPQRLELLSTVVQEMILPLMDRLKDVPSLRDAITDGTLPEGALSTPARRFLEADDDANDEPA